MAIHAVGSESCQSNLNGKARLSLFHHAGDLAFGLRLRTKAIIFSVFLFSLGLLGQMNKTKAIFIMIVLYAHPFILYFFIIKGAHVLMPLFHPISTFYIALFFSFFFFLCSCVALLVHSSSHFFSSLQHSSVPPAVH